MNDLPQRPPSPFPRRWADGVLRNFGVRLIVWVVAAKVFLGGVLLDPALQVAYYHDEHYTVLQEEAARLTMAQFGELPVWNPFSCGGIPGLGNAPSNALAPDFLLRILFGTLPGRRLTVLFFVLLGMEGTYRYARTNRASHLGGLAAGVAFACSGHFAALLSLGWVFMFNYAVAPWACLAFERGLTNLRWVLAGGFFLAWLVLGGGTYVLPYTGLALAFLMAFETARILFAPTQARLGVPVWRPLATLVGTGVVAVGLSAVRLAPMLATLAAHPRPVEQKHMDSPLTILSMVAFPRDFAAWNGQAGGAYVGAAVVGLAVLGALFADRRSAKFFCIALLFGCLACGEFTDHAPYIYLRKLPIYSQLRFPSRMTVMVSLFLALAASHGVTLVQDGLARLLSKVNAKPDGNETDMPGRQAWKLFWVGLTAFVPAAALTVMATRAVVQHNRIAPGTLYTMAAPLPVQQGFRQSRGNRWDEHIWPFANLGTLHCFEEQELPVSALLSGDLPAEEYAVDESAAKVERLQWSPHRMVLRVDAREPTVVRINQNYNPAWKSDVGTVFSDEKLLAVRVPAGQYRLVLRFSDRMTNLGAVVSATFGMALVATAVGSLRRRWRAMRRLLRHAFTFPPLPIVRDS